MTTPHTTGSLVTALMEFLEIFVADHHQMWELLDHVIERLPRVVWVLVQAAEDRLRDEL